MATICSAYFFGRETHYHSREKFSKFSRGSIFQGSFHGQNSKKITNLPFFKKISPWKNSKNSKNTAVKNRFCTWKKIKQRHKKVLFHAHFFFHAQKKKHWQYVCNVYMVSWRVLYESIAISTSVFFVLGQKISSHLLYRARRDPIYAIYTTL